MTCRTGRCCTPRRAGPRRRCGRRSGGSRRMFEAVISDFARALDDPAAPPPAHTLGRDDGPDARRFAVYRNNIAVGLIGALESRFPVTRRLVGDDFFRGMSGAFVAVHKPRDAVLIRYG